MNLTDRVVRQVPLRMTAMCLRCARPYVTSTTRTTTRTQRIITNAIAKHGPAQKEKSCRTLIRCLSTDDTNPTTQRAELMTPREARNWLLKKVKNVIDVEGDIAKAKELLLTTDLTDVADPIRLFNQILLAYSDSSETKKLEDFFWHFSNDPKLPDPDTLSFNLCLKVQPLRAAKNFLNVMLKQGMADVASFNTLIAAYCEKGLPSEAVAVLDKLMRTSREDPNIQADVFSFSPIIRMLGQRGSPEQAERLFVKMLERGIEPDLVAWSSVIHAWAISKEPEAPSRVSKLLNQIEKGNVVPDAAVYNTVLLTLANAGNQGAQAEAMMSRMVVPPNVISYTTCILAWKNSPNIEDAVERAEALLQSMESAGLHPNVVTYSTLISLYARNGMAERAEALLGQIERPNIIIYSGVIEAWAKSRREDSISRVFTLLENMQARPNVVTFNTVIKVIGNSPDGYDKIGTIKMVRSMMEQERCEPNMGSFNAILNVCAADSERLALDYALDILEEVRSTPGLLGPIENYAYPAIFKVLTNHQASFETIKNVFSLCCQDHAVTQIVVDHLKRSRNASEMRELFPVRNVKHFNLQELPKSWTRKQRKNRR